MRVESGDVPDRLSSLVAVGIAMEATVSRALRSRVSVSRRARPVKHMMVTPRSWRFARGRGRRMRHLFVAAASRSPIYHEPRARL